jgi:hypothetical protein
MSFARTITLASAVVCFFGTSFNARAIEPVALSPRATINHYNGNAGINSALWSLTNGDVPAATVAGAPPAPTVFGPLVGNADNAKCVVGDSWGPILVNTGCGIGPGIAIIRLKTTAFNGPTVALPGCTSELLITGNALGSITVNHTGGPINVPNQPIPASALGASWAAQATRRSSGGLKLSSTIYGVVDACF